MTIKQFFSHLFEKGVQENLEQKISAIEKREKEIGAFISLDIENARRRAKELEARKKKEGLGRLHGLVVAIKDNLCVQGLRCTSASKMLENYVAPYNAAVVERVLAEDGIIIGKTNMDEFACGSDTAKSAIKVTRNPIDLTRVPGGSSGGSAAAVAAGFCDLAIGSDTGGSIRCPASFCGVVGFKPSYGTVSRYGFSDLAMSFDQIGPFSKNVFGAALLYGVLAGEDYRDSTTAGTEGKEFEKTILEKEEKKLVVGIPKEFEGCDEKVAKPVWLALKKLGEFYEIREVSMPLLNYAIPVYYLNTYAEFSSAMQKYDGLKYGFPWEEGLDLVEAVSEARNASFGKEVKRRILLGTYITTKECRDAWYSKTLRARDLMRKDFQRVFSEVDLIAGPTMPVLPWKIGERMEDPIQMYLADIMTVPANLAGIPAGSVNCGFSEKLPVGIQFMANWGDDEKILRAMKKVEEFGK